MNRAIAILVATTALAIPASAVAAPALPHVPTNCHELNDLLGIDNVRSCDGA